MIPIALFNVARLLRAHMQALTGYRRGENTLYNHAFISRR